MPKKYFRKYLPSHQSVRGNRYIGILGSALHHPNLWHLNRRSVAGGVAIGMLCGMIPGPIQMFSAAVLAVILRVNLPVALAATWYTNPLTIVPLYYLAYKIGMLITGGAPATSTPPPIHLSLYNVGDWMSILWEWIGAMGKPFVFGLCTLGAALSLTSYFAVRGAWRLYIVAAWRQRQRLRRVAAAETSDP
jgi:uncharacterized protein (DUF2062 family)